MKHFISIAATPTEELRHVLDVSKRLKSQLKETGRNDPILAGKTLAMIFMKSSTRTRVSFEVGIREPAVVALSALPSVPASWRRWWRISLPIGPSKNITSLEGIPVCSL